jgi:hypothetical protein
MLYLVVRLIFRGRREAYRAVKWPCKADFGVAEVKPVQLIQRYAIRKREDRLISSLG